MGEAAQRHLDGSTHERRPRPAEELRERGAPRYNADMPIHTKVIDLDGAGAGSVHVPPSFFAGIDGATHADNEGGDLGTAQLTFGTMKFVEGVITVDGGAASGKATVYLYDL